MQRSDFNWFLNNYDDIYKKYGKKYIVVKDKTILGAYNSVREALDNTNEELGSYIIQECDGTPSAYTNFVASAFIA